MSVQPFTAPGVLTANALAGQTVPGALGVTGTLTPAGSVNAGPLAGPIPELQAATPFAGTALINGTATILTWTTPNDGKLHRFLIYAALLVATSETGGLIQVGWFGPGGATIQNTQLFAAGLAAFTQAYAPNAIPGLVAAPNTAVTVAQNSALTAGAATLWAEIWGS